MPILPCRVAFIPFICAGDPDLDTTAEALKRLDAVGASVIELGVPYSVSAPLARSAFQLKQPADLLAWSRWLYQARRLAEWHTQQGRTSARDCASVLQDPLADGPVIQGAATRSLERGTTLDKVIAMLAGVAPSLKAPVVLFTYYNPIMRRGMDTFCQQIKAAGASGGTQRTA